MRLPRQRKARSTAPRLNGSYAGREIQGLRKAQYVAYTEESGIGRRVDLGRFACGGMGEAIVGQSSGNPLDAE